MVYFSGISHTILGGVQLLAFTTSWWLNTSKMKNMRKSNSIISPGWDEHVLKKYLKPPPREVLTANEKVAKKRLHQRICGKNFFLCVCFVVFLRGLPSWEKNISFFLKIVVCFFPRWDMWVPWRVSCLFFSLGVCFFKKSPELSCGEPFFLGSKFLCCPKV